MATTSIPGGSDHNVTVYGDGTVIAGSGNNSVVLGSGTVIMGDGRDSISVQGDGTVIAGSGDNQITVRGTAQVTVGGGNDTISLSGNGRINQTGSSGNDTINVGSGRYGISVEGNATVQSANPYGLSQYGYGNYGRGAGGRLLGFGGSAAPGGATIFGGGQVAISHVSGITQEMALSGTMTLAGSTASTEFIGGSGTTVMNGKSGHDTFIGGSGHDTMTGVGSHNVFEFLSSAQGGAHVITNFVSGDQLSVDGHSLTYLLTNNQVSTHDGNTYISADGGKTTIELQGVTLSRTPTFPHHGVLSGAPPAAGAFSSVTRDDGLHNPVSAFGNHHDKPL